MASAFTSFVLTVLLFGILAPWFQTVESRYPMRSLQATDSSNVTTLAEKEANFRRWVAKVGSKKSTQFTTNVSMAALRVSDAAVANVITVSKSGDATYSTIQDAVDAVPKENSERITIQIAAGVYEEKVDIPSSKPYITFLGSGSDVTTITWDDTATSAGSTFKSASVAVNSDYFIARDISFQNTAPAPPPGAEGKQAVALRISGDMASFYSCGFYGAQDTLYDAKGRHYFQSCFIQGSIDFIFGDGQSYYEGCVLNSIATTFGSLSAQKRTESSEDTGFSFVNCKVTGSGTVFLGRSWGAYSRVVYSYTYMDDIIRPAGWDDFGDSSNQETVYYGEYQCSGPGSNSQGRVAWSFQLTAEEAAPFQTLSFIDGENWVQT